MGPPAADRPPRARPWRRPPAAARALLLALGLALLAGCGGPSSVPLAELAVEQEAYDGEEVVVRGVVKTFGEDEAVREHAVVQDRDANRVELVPYEEAEPHVDAIVEVTGRFAFEPERGRLIHIDAIEPIGDEGLDG